MKAKTARLVYCLGLFVLTACAVLPEVAPQPESASFVGAPMSVETRLAHVIRERVELQQDGAKTPALAEAVAMEAALRDLAFAGDIAHARTELISALADELSDAMADRSSLSERAEVVKADAVVRALTAAINAEVHRNRI